MIKNIGQIDRIIRLVVGFILIYVAIINYADLTVLAVILSVLGIGFIFTAITGFCVIYNLIGVNTNLTKFAITQQPQNEVKTQNQPPIQPKPQQPQPQQPQTKTEPQPQSQNQAKNQSQSPTHDFSVFQDLPPDQK
ncbi:MAG: DUF2892 domain-containing protein [Patescibacteria group bacterium]|nr:DUF2892 domain-containing protein [Patescibacteria group bacterium]